MKLLKEDLKAAAAQGFDTTEKHYHWTPRGEEVKSFAPFSHFGTAAAAHDRYINPAGMPGATIGALKDRKAQPPAEGQTVPVVINKTKVLHIGDDTGSHDPVQLARSVSAALGHDHPNWQAADALNTIHKHWTNKNKADYAETHGAGYYMREFDGVDRETGEEIPHNAERVRDMWHDDMHREVFHDEDHSEHDPDAEPDSRETAKIAEVNPEATAKGFAHVQKLLDKHGVTALSYTNAAEDKGSTSWIVPNPKHVRSVHAAFKNPEGTDIMEDMMTVSSGAVAGIGAGGEPGKPDLSFRDQPGVDMKDRRNRLLIFKRAIARRRMGW